MSIKNKCEIRTTGDHRRIEKSTAYTYEIYRQHFGTIGQLRNVCGFKVETKRATPVITKVDCKRELLEIYRKYGRASYSQLQEKSTISMSTMIRKFHTTKINEIWDEVLKDKVDSTADKSTDLSDMSWIYPPEKHRGINRTCLLRSIFCERTAIQKNMF